MKKPPVSSRKPSCDSDIFPSTRFYGSKRKQSPWLEEELRRLTGSNALDAFGGTGAVSHLLAKLGWKTTYNDIFEFNTISARAIFSNSINSLSRYDLSKFLEQVVPVEGFISRTYEGIYFKSDENRWLDGFMNSLNGESSERRDLLLHFLFQACLKKRPFNLFHRSNLKLRTSNIPVQFGNRTTWSKSFATHIFETYEELKTTHFVNRSLIQVNSAICAKKISEKYDLIYIDPPYFKHSKRNTDTYLQRYHFLEGLARFTEWPSIIDYASSQKIIKGPYRDEWTNKFDMISNLRTMIQSHQNTKFVLSYVSGEAPTEDELFNLFKENFDRVRLSRRSFNKALSKKESFEILIIGQ
ncbi:MAG: DNA adenine methylase [Pseudomonadota bacterium]